jgi:hypothetical protein
MIDSLQARFVAGKATTFLRLFSVLTSRDREWAL